MMMRRACLLVIGVLLLVGGLVAPAPAAKARGETHKVTVEGGFPRFTFEPADITISAGDKVVWLNNTSAEHHIQPYAGPWAEGTHGHLEPDGGKASLTFKKPGVYKYYCDLPFHGQLLPGEICAGQCGTVTVN